jgi:pyruvate-formate lyase-activating enzyme
MSNQFIFYGAGKYARQNLETWLIKGLIPVCFADADKSKHYKKIRPRIPKKTEFDVLSFEEALNLYPDADIYITINTMADPKTYKDICDHIMSKGVSSERIGVVPDTATGRQCIFYGAGLYANMNLKRWVFNGIIPVCFVDSNEQKHNTKMHIPLMDIDGEFEILPVHEALERYPQAFLYITTSSESYDAVYNNLINEGVSAERIGAPPQHCRHIGRHFMLKEPVFSYCCDMGFSEVFPVAGNIKDDVKLYYEVCEKLRNDLNIGKLTSCAGCQELRPGRSDEKLKMTVVTLDSGIPGATKCNFKCCYCFHGMNYLKKTQEREENVLDILRYLGENEDISYLGYASAEISVSPYRREVLDLLKRKKWKGTVLTNAYKYVEELKDLLSEGNFTTTVSIDAGTKETFAKIKGVDGFDEVVQNLEKYASSGGKIELKYIVLDGINNDKSDLDGFINIAEKIGATVIITWDMRSSFTAYSDVQYEAVSYLARQCVLRDLTYYFFFDTPEYVERLKKDELYQAGPEIFN